MKIQIRLAWRRAPRHGIAAALAGLVVATAAAHDFSVGSLEITHPFATPSVPGATVGAAYFATLENGGNQPDKLVRVTTPVATSVEMHTMSVDAQGVMRMREVDAIAIAPKTSIKMRPGMGFHLMLVGLNKPLKEGDTFAMSLQFEHAGKVDVKVYVQTPRPDAAMHDMHTQ
jgi:periplasmic copper chaperone A